jgi:hypothetical protein
MFIQSSVYSMQTVRNDCIHIHIHMQLIPEKDFTPKSSILVCMDLAHLFIYLFIHTHTHLITKKDFTPKSSILVCIDLTYYLI